MGAGVGPQPRRRREHDRREQRDRRVEAEHRRCGGRRDEDESQQSARALSRSAGHPGSQRIEHAGAAAAIGEQQQRREEPHGRPQLAQR
jgi:hypothetical protein